MDTPSGQLRALLYARKSSYRGKKASVGRSVAEQLEEERRWCADNGAVEVDTYIDDDRSASRYATKEREEFERLVGDIQARRGNIVLAWESSRLQRDLDVYVRLRKACMENDVLWCYGGRIYDMNDRDDRRMTAYDAIRDEDAAEEISARVKRAMRANARDGRPHGVPLYGYRRVYDDRRKLISVEIVESEAKVIREVARRVAESQNLIPIAEELNARGIPSPGGSRWIARTVRRLLLNPAYAGIRVHNGAEVGPATWQPILEEGVYETCRAVLLDPSRRTNRDVSIKHLLSGVGRCQICGAPARVTNHQSGAYKVYWCYPRGHFMVKKEPIEDYIETTLVTRLARPDAAEFFAVKEHPEAARERVNVARWENDLAEGERLVEAGEMTMTRLANLEKRLIPKMEAARARLRQVTTNPLLAQLIRPTVEEVWEQWSGLQIVQRRAVLRAAFTEILIAPPGRGRVRPPEEFVSYLWRDPAAGSSGVEGGPGR
ncbi:site-specific recombinase DNA invertase Pin [Sphaerisporangium siamense]|uniref:DNA invertase Pin-like site-specific DNA recombinase n=1 Tax=Sphaerisporangium siamense TaxID=795645 RepID=A0A7W7G967_9ACTN|nr:recombinase family protein [Sphaerisporangium siamense]MBB4702503.1 DNA invertase Pin-like site-specific DNA recombinase [Sphaerisporangium siamense]GII88201.1 site-specific recombinase DNA invertase Pin [Sphaerisporangium siamense]